MLKNRKSKKGRRVEVGFCEKAFVFFCWWKENKVLLPQHIIAEFIVRAKLI